MGDDDTAFGLHEHMAEQRERRTFRPGDRVRVHDAELAMIQAICERDPGFTQPSFRNDEGTVDEVHDGMVYITFDSEDGPGMGANAPYPIADVSLLASSVSTPNPADEDEKNDD